MKCNKCRYVYICREENKEYCYIDEENIKNSKSANSITNLEKEYKKYEDICSHNNLDSVRMNTINARMTMLRLMITNKNVEKEITAAFKLVDKFARKIELLKFSESHHKFKKNVMDDAMKNHKEACDKINVYNKNK